MTPRSAMRTRGILVAVASLAVVAAVWSATAPAPAPRPSGPNTAAGTSLPPIPGSTAAFDVRDLPQLPSRAGHDRDKVPEHEGPAPIGAGTAAFADIGSGVGGPSIPAPATDTSFDGLAYTDTCGTSQCGDGHPPDTNGDVGPTYYIEVVNTAIGVFNKTTGSRVAAFTFNSFMSQGAFGNLCDTDNFGDPVVLYDTFQDRWFITDFAFQVDGSGNVVSPPGAFQCMAVSKTGNPVTGGWNYYSMNITDGLHDYPKFGIWPDGIYMSANVFPFAAGGSFKNVRVWALDKAAMYAGEPLQVVSFNVAKVQGCSPFTLLPSNARAQAGTPPAGRENLFTSVWCSTNSVQVWKLHADWTTPGNSTFTGPSSALTGSSWGVGPQVVPSKNGNDLDTLYIRLMVQNQYSNLNGVESLWDSHTVAGSSASQAAVRWYQLPVTGGTVGSALQASTYNPDGDNRFMSSIAVDRLGDMALGYSVSSSTTFPAIRYAGRLAGDSANAITQTEATLMAGGGSQSGNCGGAPCERWGDYSAMTLDPNGCSFWYTNEYYADLSLNDHTRIGSFRFAGCTDAPPYTQPPATATPPPPPPTPTPLPTPTIVPTVLPTSTPILPTATIGSATQPPDSTPPALSAPGLSPNPVIPGATVTVTSTATDAVAVASAQKQLNGGTWTAMSALDGSFGGTSEALTSTVTAPATPGTYSVCVRATDSTGNTSNGLACTTLTVMSYSLAPATGSASVAQGRTASYTINITRSNFAGSIALSASGLPAGAAATFTPNPSGGASAGLSITTSNCGTVTPRGTSTVTVTGMSGGLTKTTTVSLTVTNSAPTEAAPVSTLYGGTTLGSTTVRVKTAWSACDPDGIKSYQLQRQVNGGTWTTVTLGSATATSITQALTKNATYRFRIRSTDKTSLTSGYVYGPSFKPIVSDNTSTAITYTGTWGTSSSSAYFGGSSRFASAAGASATYSFTGSSVAWVAYKSTTRGSAQIYIDGVLKTTVSLYSTTTTARAQVYAFNWATSGAHTIKVVVVGTAGHPRVDIDAFVRISPA